MNKQKKLSELRRLQSKMDSIRRELQISSPGEILALYALDGFEGQRILVEADGFGGATTLIVEGNYPIDYYTKFEKHFQPERIAESAAEDLFEKNVSPNEH